MPRHAFEIDCSHVPVERAASFIVLNTFIFPESDKHTTGLSCEAFAFFMLARDATNLLAADIGLLTAFSLFVTTRRLDRRLFVRDPSIWSISSPLGMWLTNASKTRRCTYTERLRTDTFLYPVYRSIYPKYPVGCRGVTTKPSSNTTTGVPLTLLHCPCSGIMFWSPYVTCPRRSGFCTGGTQPLGSGSRSTAAQGPRRTSARVTRTRS